MYKLRIPLAALLLAACAHKAEHADLVIHNGVVYTLDDNNTMAEAIAVVNGKIVEVGPERQIMNKYSADEYIDARGRAVYPGFFDAHCHILPYGKTFLEADLREAGTWENAVKKTAEFAAKNNGAWIIGRGWDQNKWPGKQFPDKTALDLAFPGRPVYLVRVDGHAAVVNSKALELAGITKDTRVEGGTVMLTGNEPNGLLIDNAMELVKKHIPAITGPEMEKALALAGSNTAAYGLTTLCDAGSTIDVLKTIEKLQDGNRFMPRVYGMLVPDKKDMDFAAQNGIYNHSDRMLIRSFKIVADGALGSRGACLRHDYSDAPGVLGKLLYSPAGIDSLVRMAFEMGYQVNTHCIGDSANALVLRTYAKYLQKTNDLRWRIEHAQVLDTADLAIFARYSIIPSVQPTHAVSDMPWAVDRVGHRIRGAYLFKDLMQQNGLIALGTDFPVEDINPFKTFYAAISRSNYAGQPLSGLQQEVLSREQALLGMTKWAAMAAFMEKQTGSLEKGKYADIIIVDRDIMKVPERDILKALVVMTFIGGKQVHSLE